MGKDRGELVSARCRNRIERVARAVEARNANDQVLHYAPRDFVLCGLPYKRPKTPAVYERRNGNFRFRVVGDPDYGVPFGQDRLIAFWLATAYRAQGCPDDRTIVFRCAADILKCYQIQPDGRQYVRLRERIERVFGATYFVYDETPGSALSRELGAAYRDDGGVDSFFRADSYRLISSVRLWFHRRQRPNQYTLWDNTITLSDQFARDVKNVGVPVDLQTVTALRDRPAALDLYVWQAMRSWRLARTRQRSVRIPLHGDRGLLAQLGTQAKRARKGVELVRSVQRLIKAAWPSCPNTLEGDTFVVRPAQALPPACALRIPGVVDPPARAGSLRAVRGEDAELVRLGDGREDADE